MSTETLKLPRGEKITFGGSNFKLVTQAKVRVIKCDKEAKKEAQGEQKTDDQPKRLKRIVCQIIEKRIQELEQKEADSLHDICEDDVLFLFDSPEITNKNILSDQIGRTSSITDLQRILKQVKAL